jgi:plasmid stabilization system protein ParE
MAAKIYPAARERLLQIWDYTEKKWGAEQADRYVTGLIEKAHQLSLQRRDWRPMRGKSFAGIWFARHEHHYLFFREFSDGHTGVISILHENMDFPMRLKDDVEREGE